jgi:hypothetical protein
VLGDAAGLALDHIGAAQRIEQAGLAVIDVAHDRDHRRTGFSVSAGSTSSLVSMSTSLSETRVMLWPNSSTSSSAVSWSMVWLTVTIMPMLNSALTRSAPFSAMRLASSCTVIASGTTTSRTCFSRGLLARPGRGVPSRARASARRGCGRGAFVLVERAGDGQLAGLAAIVDPAARCRARFFVLLLAWPSGGTLGFGTLDRREPARRRNGIWP